MNGCKPIAELPVWRFREGRWRAQTDRPPLPLSALSVVTFNVWFGDYLFAQRAASLCRLLGEIRADVIGLQEVTQPFLRHLLGEAWLREDYWVSDVSGSTFLGYGVVLLSRLPVRRLWLLELPTAMERRLLAADLGDLTVATVHLESLSFCDRQRAEQMAVIFPALESARSAVLMGDMNFDAGTPENARIDPRYRDLWPELDPHAPGWTLDNAVNTMRHALGKNPIPARLDRILLRGDWQGSAIRLLGTDPIAPQVHPSDHFGLHATLTRSGCALR